MDCKEVRQIIQEIQNGVAGVGEILADALQKIDNEQCDDLPFDLEKESAAAWAYNLVSIPLALAEFNIKTEIVKDYFTIKDKPVTEDVAAKIARKIVEPISRIDSKVIEEGYALVKSGEITFNF